MNFFVAGANGVIDSYLIEKLAVGRGQIYVLVHESSRHNFRTLKARMAATAAQRVIPVCGSLNAPCLDLSANDMKVLKGNIDHFLYFTAIAKAHDHRANPNTANIDRIANAVQAAKAMQAGYFHQLCSAVLNESFLGPFQEPRLDAVAPPTRREARLH